MSSIPAIPADQRFSDGVSARKWTDMYDSATEVLEEANFRARRDVSVEYVQRVLPAGGQVLDIGCGSAPVLAELRKRGIRCVGLEHSEDMLKHAARRLQSMGLDAGGLHRGDCVATGFDSASFDVIVCLGVVSYVEHYGELLDEIHRLLKPGGYALISFRNKFNLILWDPVRTLKWAVKALLGRNTDEPYKIGRFMDHREFTAKALERRFEYRDFFGIGFGPLRLSGRTLLTERRSIQLSDFFARLFARLGSDLPGRWLADVSLWVYQKAAADAAAPTRNDRVSEIRPAN
jgi:ubiquinone/menaquinone biosynthesis C-methylase UbiE